MSGYGSSEAIGDMHNYEITSIQAENKDLKSRIDDLEQTLGIVYFCGDIKSHFPETHKMVEQVLKEGK